MPILRRSTKPTIAFNMRPQKEPWGGGNWWVSQVARDLGEQGYEVRFDLRRGPDCVVLVDPRVGGNVRFGADEIVRNPASTCLHRINECDLRKGTNEIDALLADANRVADHTVFISDWLRDYHAERWFDTSRASSVIHNGADPAIFNPARLDARQWARAARAAGFRAMILTAKHHDGFCLWPTRTTRHSVVSSPWRGGNGTPPLSSGQNTSTVRSRRASAYTRSFSSGFGRICRCSRNRATASLEG